MRSLLTVVDGRVHCVSSLRKGHLPQLDRDAITLTQPGLGIARNMARPPNAGAACRL